MSATRALQLFEPRAHAVYTIDIAARLADLPRHTVLLCWKYGLVAPVTDSAAPGYYFTGNTVHVLRRIAALREICGDDLPAIKIILELLERLDQMHAELQVLRTKSAGKSQSNPQGRKNSFKLRRYSHEMTATPAHV
jgi:DNA-binding transcriptional MerR regulator